MQGLKCQRCESHASSAQKQLGDLGRGAFEEVDAAEVVVAIDAVAVEDALPAGLEALGVADSAAAEIGDDLVADHDLLAGAADAEHQVVVVVEALAGEEPALLVGLSGDEGGGVVPVAAGGMLFQSRVLDQGLAVVLDQPDVRVEDVEGLFRIGAADRLQGVGLVPVVGIDDADDFAGGHPDALVHGVVDAPVRLADDGVAVALCREARRVFPGDRDGAVRRAAVDDEILHLAVGLVQDGLDGVPDGLLAIVADRDDADQHWHFRRRLKGS